LWAEPPGKISGGTANHGEEGAREAGRNQGHSQAPQTQPGTNSRSVAAIHPAGHYRYYGVPFNYAALHRFRRQLKMLWHRTLARRSQKGRLSWVQMERIAERWLPPASIHHPYPSVRFDALTQGRSRVR